MIRPAAFAVAVAFASGCASSRSASAPSGTPASALRAPADRLHEPFASFFSENPAVRAAAGDFAAPMIFGQWGDANVFEIGGRRLALVVRTSRAVDPENRKHVQRLGLYDVTDPAAVAGRRFDPESEGSVEVELVDGGPSYLLALEPRGDDIAISVTGAHGEAPRFGLAGQTRLPTINELFRLRALLALASSTTMTVAGRTFRVTVESSGTGNLLLWSELTQSMAKGAAGHARRLVPELMAEAYRVVDGRTTRAADRIPFGYRSEGEWWGLAWDASKEAWAVKRGPEFDPAR